MPPPHRHPPHPPGHHPEHPPHPHHKGKHRRGHVPASRVLDFVDPAGLEGWLSALVPDAADRAFVTRCLVEEGPVHHRGSNYILLALLSRAVLARGGVLAATTGEPVPMRLPPHLADALEDPLTGDDGDSAYPLKLPVTALRALAGDDPRQLEAMIDCLTDGPPQHALANVVMVALIESLLGAPAADSA